jgi:26S proteasome regulatory subunit N10
LTKFSLDNSEYNRNGDFAPSRWDSQQDAANVLCDAKLNQNPENTIGLMSMAGKK